MNDSRSLLFAGITLACAALRAAEAPPAAVVIPPKVIESSTRAFGSHYPVGARRDALVYVRFNVNARGEVTDAEVDEGGFYSPEFQRAALATVKSLRFEPATLNGQPVEYMGERFGIGYMTGDSSGNPIKGVTREFRSEALKAQKLIQAGDFAGAEHHASWMMSEKVALRYEFAVLQSTLADTYARTGQHHLALAAAREVTARFGMKTELYEPGGPLPKLSAANFLLPKDQMAQLLRLRFVLADSLGFSLDALRAHADLQALGLVVEEDPTTPRFRELLRSVQATPEMKGHARLGQRGWTHPFLFHRFTIAGVRGGAVRRISLSCAGFRRELDFMPDTEWGIPSKYRNCSARFDGDPGAEFDIIEFRDAQGAGPLAPPG